MKVKGYPFLLDLIVVCFDMQKSAESLLRGDFQTFMRDTVNEKHESLWRNGPGEIADKLTTEVCEKVCIDVAPSLLTFSNDPVIVMPLEAKPRDFA
jgi:hypothetical protein